MSINCYLAMTAAEFYSAKELPPCTAWMACHFSSYGTGLSNFPPPLPSGSMLIVNDRTPLHGHDPQQIAEELSALAEKIPDCRILLDFQRSDCPETAVLVNALISQLSCPIGVSDCYATGLSCPVFLSPPPLHLPLEDYLAPWTGREIWIEAAWGQTEIAVTTDGCHIRQQSPVILSDAPFEDARLHCKYSISIQKDAAVFSLVRDNKGLTALLQEAENLGVCLAVGLFQQLKDFPSKT